jgi:hypothetical protein
VERRRIEGHGLRGKAGIEGVSTIRRSVILTALLREDVRILGLYMTLSVQTANTFDIQVWVSLGSSMNHLHEVTLSPSLHSE